MTTAPVTAAARPRRGARDPGELLRTAFVLGLGVPAIVVGAAGHPDAPAARWIAEAAALLGALALLRLRHRYPVLVAGVLAVASAAISPLIGAAVLAIVSLATWRRWWQVAGVGVLFVGTTLLADAAQGGTSGPWWERAGVVVLVYAACVATGAYQGSRRELLAALRERAAAAEREQAARVEQAQVAERTRIAREMHDVLAHRISLVAMHADVLAFRSDLPDADRAATAVVVRDNANLALAELRQVLGVLRTGASTAPAGAPGAAEPPQPTLARLDDLVRDAREAGAEIDLSVTPGASAHLPGLPGQLSRDAYRIVQEALTNARKHAPGGTVRVQVDGTPGGLLVVEVRNGPGTGVPSGIPGSGTGLVGVAERVRLSGGDLEHGPDDGGYRLRALLPWPEED